MQTHDGVVCALLMCPRGWLVVKRVVAGPARPIGGRVLLQVPTTAPQAVTSGLPFRRPSRHRAEQASLIAKELHE